METRTDIYATKLLKRRWLSRKTFEIELTKPSSFKYKPGQRICVIYNSVDRDYSLASTPSDDELVLCIRKVAEGALSPQLSMAPIGSRLDFTGPHGYFTYRPSPRPAIFIATGTGIAPFCSIVRSGVTEYTLLHGVTLTDDLYYHAVFRSTAKLYVPCVSETGIASDKYFHGRVTDYLQLHLASGRYDFYLCGRQEMIRDVTFLVDEKFPESFVHTEIYY
jgi:NAD(P)H-flavin reductase